MPNGNVWWDDDSVQPKGANIQTMVNCLKGEVGQTMECDEKTDLFIYLFKLIETFLSRQMFHSTMAVGMWLEAGSQTTPFFFLMSYFEWWRFNL